MTQISNNKLISMTRGDTLSFAIKINKGTVIDPDWYELGEDDYVLFGVMEPHQPFEHALIRKTYTIEDMTEDKEIYMNLSHEDTARLLPGTYYYEVKLVTKTSDEDNPIVDTVIPRKRFFIYE